MLKRFIFAALVVMFAMSACAYGSNFPVSYDLRALGRVTPVRDQEWLGTCWAFGVMGAVESNYLTKYVSNDSSVTTASKILGGVNSADLSELHMSWYIRNDPDKRWRETSVMPRNRSIATLNGATTLTAVAYLTRVDGPVLETSLPYLSKALLGRMGYSSNVLSQWYEMKQYPTYEFLQTLANTLSKDLIASGDKVPILPGLKQKPETYGVRLRLTDVLYSSQTPVKFTSASDDNRDCISNDAVKALVRQHGGVAIGYQTEDKGLSGSSYYYKDGTKTNHEVVIVGWNDNYSADKFPWPTRPTKNGAWIVKNSWGTDWADKGYFYMSYEQHITEGAAFIVEDRPDDLTVYQHDPLGWCSTYGASANTLYAANVFKVRYDNEQLEGISFYTTEAGAVVDWEIYDNGSSKPTDKPYVDAATKRAGGSKPYPHAGYHTLKMADVNASVTLTKGTYFSVVLKITNPSAMNPLVVERKMENNSDFAAVHDCESWFSENGSNWWDGVDTHDGRKHIPMNATIKAFTTGATGTEVEADKLTILGKNLDTFMDEVSVKNVESSPDVKPNANIPDEPLAERMIFAPSNLSGDTYIPGTLITYYLANVTEDHEFVDSYEGNPDTTYPTGMSPYEPDRELDPLFEEGYEPDVFWVAGDGGEYPVYGPFVTSVDKDGYVYLNVHHLDYGNDSGDLGLIPKGYYDFVYTGPQGEKGFIGSVELRLAASDHSLPESGDITSPDVIYVSRDVIQYLSRDVIRYVSRDVPVVSREVVTVGIGSSSSSGCTSGFGLAGLILISALAFSSKKR